MNLAPLRSLSLPSLVVLRHGILSNVEFHRSIARQHLACAFFPETGDPSSLPLAITVVPPACPEGHLRPLPFLTQKPSEFTDITSI